MPKGRGGRETCSCLIPSSDIKSLHRPQLCGHSSRWPEGTKATFQFQLHSSLPASPEFFHLIRQAFAMRCTRVAFLPGKKKKSQLFLAWFQEMLISAINWGLICIPYGLLAVLANGDESLHMQPYPTHPCRGLDFPNLLFYTWWEQGNIMLGPGRPWKWHWHTPPNSCRTQRKPFHSACLEA